jgi:hypothetical protein
MGRARHREPRTALVGLSDGVWLTGGASWSTPPSARRAAGRGAVARGRKKWVPTFLGSYELARKSGFFSESIRYLQMESTGTNLRDTAAGYLSVGQRRGRCPERHPAVPAAVCHFDPYKGVDRRINLFEH